MDNWVADVLQQLGYLGLLLLMFLENVFPPIPSELIMPLAGYLVAKGELSFLGVVLAGTAGSVLGAVPLYWLGYRLGRTRMIHWADRHGRWLTIRGAHIERAIAWLDRHGRWAIFLGRLVPGLRSLISIPAGIARLSFAPFLALTALGSLLWSTLLATAGYLLGAGFDEVEHVLSPVSNAVLIGVLLLYAWRVASGRGRQPPPP
jgi:membrane protein DedA with SNARE-associated domain